MRLPSGLSRQIVLSMSAVVSFLPSVLFRMATALPWHTAHLFPIRRTTIHMP